MMILIISFASCSSSDDEPVQDGQNPNQSEASAANVIGRWMGSSCIKSLRGGYRYSYVTLDLNSDGTGQVKQENDDDEIIFLGEFTWTIADKKIQCQGVSASISGNVNTNFTTSFEYRDGRLYGIDRFEFYILGKGEDSFPCVNGDGEEIIDRSEFLDGVWVLNNGKEVLEIEVKDFNNYTQSYSLTTRLYFLSSNAGNSYDAMVEDKYAGYYLVENTLWLYVTDIDQKDCKIWTLTENELRLIYGDTDKTYTKGSYKDIPGKKNLDNILANIWVEWQDRITVLDLRTPGVYIEYTKDEAFSDRYIEKKVGSYSYDDDGKYLTFTVDGKSETWTIDYLLDTGMELSQNRKTWSFYRCYEDEIPTTPVGDNPDKPDNPDSPDEPDIDIMSYLLHDKESSLWESTAKPHQEFIFYSDNRVYYYEYPQFDSTYNLILRAHGTFQIENLKVICDFEYVSWYYSEEYPDLYPGWSNGVPCQKKYKIEIINKDHMVVTMPDGKKVNFDRQY